MFSKKENKYALLMSNDLKGCQEDVIRLEKILLPFNFKITTKRICYPRIEIENFLKTVINPDLIYIHYSGHGIKRGKKINNEHKIVTSWLNPNKTVVNSDDIDRILSEIKCNIILTTDCCHSETFGNYYVGKFPFIFIGTSALSMLSRTYALNGEPLHGSLVYLFEYLIKNNHEISLENINKYNKQYFKENGISSHLIIKTRNSI